MLTSKKVQWGVLIYACGNNDLAPEITRSVLALFRTGRFKEVSLAVQLGRAPRDLISILRPGDHDQGQDGGRRGVRRFLRVEGCSGSETPAPPEPVEDLGNLDMACPSSLRDFLIWSTKMISAKQYLVILSGHGAGFIGAMADFSQGRPQIMGVPQMAKAFHTALNHTGKKVKYLLMDACYMNLVENAYEFAVQKAAGIFWGSGGFVPLEGYAYKQFIDELCGQKFFSNKQAMAVNGGTLSGVEAVLLNKFFFTVLKQQLSALAERLIHLGLSPATLNPSDETLIDLSELLHQILNLTTDPVLTKISNKALKLLNKINLTDSGMNIFCPGQPETFIHFAKYYGALSFAKNNCWPLWLSGGAMRDSNSFNDSFSATLLPLGMLTEHLLNLNAGMTINEARGIYKKLGWE